MARKKRKKLWHKIVGTPEQRRATREKLERREIQQEVRRTGANAPKLPAETECLVVGSEYYDGIRTVTLGPEQGVTIRPEPTNPHDRNAIVVHVRGKKVGYLSRGVAERLRPHVVGTRSVEARGDRIGSETVLRVKVPRYRPTGRGESLGLG